MEKLFALDGKFNQFMSKVADLLLLNLMWIICSLPIITIGASTTALFDVLLEMTEDEEAYVVRTYIRYFAKNQKESTKLWLLFLTVQTLFSALFASGFQVGSSVIVAGSMIGEVFFLVYTFFAFPLLAWNGDRKLGSLLKKSAFLGVAALPWTGVLLLGSGILFAVTLCYPLPAALLLLFIGVAGVSYMMSVIYRHVFQKYGVLREKDVQNEVTVEIIKGEEEIALYKERAEHVRKDG